MSLIFQGEPMPNKIIAGIKKVKLKPFSIFKNASTRKHMPILKNKFILTSKKAEEKIYDGVFYRLEKDGKYFYVGGSIHVGKKSNIRFNELVEKAFEESTKLAVEIDITDGKNLIEIVKVMKDIDLDKTKLEDKQLGFDYFLPENKTKYESLCKELGLNPERYSKLSPSSFYVIAQQKLMKKAGFKSKCGIDDLFVNKAKKSKKEIISLETPKIQFNALMAAANMSSECLANESEKIGTLDGLESLVEGISKTHDAIFEGNINKLVNEILIYKPVDEADKEHLNTFLYHRNEMMVTNIEKLIESGETCFVVVGAAHVIGKGGLLKLFKEKGYTIARLK
jgi:uncharacterized protein